MGHSSKQIRLCNLMSLILLWEKKNPIVIRFSVSEATVLKYTSGFATDKIQNILAKIVISLNLTYNEMLQNFSYYIY